MLAIVQVVDMGFWRAGTMLLQRYTHVRYTNQGAQNVLPPSCCIRWVQVSEMGFWGSAVLGAVWQAQDPVGAFAALLRRSEEICALQDGHGAVQH